MTFWFALRRLLPLLAVLGFALTPVAAPAAIAGMRVPASVRTVSTAGVHAVAVHQAALNAMDMADEAMDDMPCCPKAKVAQPDCGTGCPLAGLCLATTAPLLPATIAVPLPMGMRVSQAWPAPARFVSAHGSPLPEPPRA